MADNESAPLSEEGLRILANPSVYVSDEEIQRMKGDRERQKSQIIEMNRRKSDRQYRREQQMRNNTSEISENASDTSAGTSDWRQRLHEMHKRSVLESVPEDTHSEKTKSRSPRRSPRRSRSRSRSRSHSRSRTSHSSRRSRSRSHSRPRRRSRSKSRSQASSSELDKSVMEEVVREAMEKLGVNRGKSEKYKSYIEQELRHRLRQVGETSDVEGDDDLRKKELRYWRKHMSLEDEELANSFSTFVNLISTIIETFVSDVMGIHVFETKGLAASVEKAVESGRFRSAIRHFCNSGGSSVMANPITNALITFSSIALKNHLRAQKGILTDPADEPNTEVRKTRKQRQELLLQRAERTRTKSSKSTQKKSSKKSSQSSKKSSQNFKKSPKSSKKSTKTGTRKPSKRHEPSSESSDGSSGESSGESSDVSSGESLSQSSSRSSHTSKSTEKDKRVKKITTKKQRQSDSELGSPPIRDEKPDIPDRFTIEERKPAEMDRQSEVSNLSNDLEQMMGPEERVSAAVVDPKTGKTRTALKDSGPEFLNGMEALGSTVTTLAKSTMKAQRLNKKKKALGTPPAPFQ